MDHRGSRNTLNAVRNAATPTPDAMRNRSPEPRVTSIILTFLGAAPLVSTSANFIGTSPPAAGATDRGYAAWPMPLTNGSHRESALLLLGDELPPKIAPLLLCSRHAASDRKRFTKWCLPMFTVVFENPQTETATSANPLCKKAGVSRSARSVA
jgi:hypothetical protein